MLGFVDLLFCFIYLNVILFLLLGLNRLEPRTAASTHQVSVIIALRNEEKNVEGCFNSLLNQDYPEDLLEIIFIDDNSDDQTAEKLKLLAKNQSHVKIIHQKNSEKKGNKKAALQRGIAASHGEILMFTDADCRPSPDWIRSMLKYFDSEVGMVIGFSPWIGGKSILHRIIHIDSMAAGFVAAGTAGYNSPVTCTGRNLAYRRKIFHQINGFAAIEHSTSGDDDLFLHQVRKKTKWKISYSIEPESMVQSVHNLSLTEFFRQKVRHLSAGKYYNRSSQIGYGLFHFSNLIIWSVPIAEIFMGKTSVFPIAILILKIISDRIAILRMQKIFHQQISNIAFLGWEFLFLFYNVFLAPFSWFSKIKWK